MSKKTWLRGRWLFPAGLVVLALLPFVPALLGDGVFISRDHLAHFLPKRALLAERLAGEGSVLWTSKVSLGTPWLADPQNGAYYPPLPLLFLLLPFRVAYVLFPALHVALAGLGTYALARQLRRSRVAAFLAGVTVQWSGFVFSTVQLTNNLSSFAWTPVAMACGWRAARETGFEFKWRMLTGLVLAVTACAGEPQVAIFTALFTACLVVVHSRRLGRAWRSTLGSVTLVAVVAAGLAAAQALPLLELTSLTRRAEGIPVARLELESLRPHEWVDFLSPAAFENADGLRWSGTQTWLSALYVGWLPIFAIACMRRRHWRQWWAWLLPAGLGFALAAGTRMPGFGFLHEHLGFGLFRYPTRFLFLAVPVMGVLTAVGLDSLRAQLRARKVSPLRMALPALCALTLSLLYFTRQDWPADVREQAAAGLARGAVLAGMAGLACLASARWRLSHVHATSLVVLLACMDLALYRHPGFETAPLADIMEAGVAERALTTGSHGEPARGVCLESAASRQVFSQDSSLSHVERSRRQLSFLADGGATLLGTTDVRRDPIFPLLSYEALHYALTELRSKPLARFLGVRSRAQLKKDADGDSVRHQMLDSDRVPLRLAMPRRGGIEPKQLFDAITAKGSILAEALPVPSENVRSPWNTSAGPCAREGDVRMTSWSESTLTAEVRLDCPAILVHTSPLLPGWTASINENPAHLFPALGSLQAVWVPRGVHEVRFEYRPWSVAVGFLISILTLFACSGVLALEYRRSRG